MGVGADIEEEALGVGDADDEGSVPVWLLEDDGDGELVGEGVAIWKVCTCAFVKGPKLAKTVPSEPSRRR